MAELNLTQDKKVNNRAPHGYFRDLGRQQVNYKSPTKRSFLNECIRQIYVMNGITTPLISIPVEYNKIVIWHKLNMLMRPARMSIQQVLRQRVKRRLFSVPKKRQNKSQKPQFNNSKLSEAFYFKPSRHILGIRKIPRNYLDQASKNIQNDLRQKLKRKFTTIQEEENAGIDNALHFHTSEGVLQVPQQDINKVCVYHANTDRQEPQVGCSAEEQIKWERNAEVYRIRKRVQKLEEMIIEEQYRQNLIAREKVLEASIRSILHVKTLMGLMVDQPDNGNLYV